MQIEEFHNHVKPLETLTEGEAVGAVCEARYRQINGWSTVHMFGELLKVSVNGTQVGSISFDQDDTAKTKTITLDITKYLTKPENNLQVALMIDKDYLYKNARSEAEFTFHMKGRRIFKKEFETELPAHSTINNWAVRL